MSLFKWSTPERHSGDRILPIIPNEIYLHILEYVAPPTGPLATEELDTFTNLTGVCRFFANVCLPRIFAFVECSGSVLRASSDVSSPATSRGRMLCSQIAAKQPLALVLAKTVKTCHFTDWKLDQTGSWAVRLFAKRYIDGMVHMVNIRQLHFFESFVDIDHWNAIATLRSLEELSFDICRFMGGPADLAPGKWTKIKVTRLRLTTCTEEQQAIAAIDPRYLRAVIMDPEILTHSDFLSQSPLIELHFRSLFTPDGDLYVRWLDALLERASHSLESLCIYVCSIPPAIQDIAGSIFDRPQWKNFPLLRSLTLRVPVHPTFRNFFPSALANIHRLRSLESFILKGGATGLATTVVPPAQLLCIIREKVPPRSNHNLKHVVVYGTTFHLVGEEWTQRLDSSEVLPP